MRPSTLPEESEWIDAYLGNQLTASGKAEFEAIMAVDKNLQEGVKLHHLLHDVIDEYNLQAEIAAIHAEMMEEEEEVSLMETRVIRMPVNRPELEELASRNQFLVERPLWWKRTAGIAAAAGGICLGYLSFAPITPFDGANHIMRGGKKATQERPSSFCYDTYYKGLEYLSNEQPDKAISRFEEVVSCEVRPYFRDASKWFLAVACLEAGQTDRAKALVNEIRHTPVFQYPVKTIDFWKMEMQIRLAQITQ